MFTTSRDLSYQEHDYSNILVYFNCMADLRREETEVRDWIIGELNTERARQASNSSALEMLQENLADCEKQVMSWLLSIRLFP